MRPNNNSGRYTVAIHRVSDEYGGPEEGGWYYEAGEPHEAFGEYTRTFKSRKAASKYEQRLYEMLCAKYPHLRRKVWSLVQINTVKPYAWPKQRPRYW